MMLRIINLIIVCLVIRINSVQSPRRQIMQYYFPVPSLRYFDYFPLQRINFDPSVSVYRNFQRPRPLFLQYYFPVPSLRYYDVYFPLQEINNEASVSVFSDSEKTPLDPSIHQNWHLLEHNKCGLSQADRIIGGKDAALGAYPWIARLGYISNKNPHPIFRCGAVLVGKYYVVTAAHCVTNLPNKLSVGVVRLGEHNTDTNPDCEDEVCADSVKDFRPSEIIVHKDYGKPQFKNDIAVIRLNLPVTFTSYVMPICAIHGKLLTKNYVGETSEVAGWGIYDIENPQSSKILQTIKLPIVNNAKCEEAFKEHAEIGPTQMCVGGEVGHDSCGGDSGGPLMKVDTVDGPPKYYLLGVVSFGAKRCGATTMPGVYTRISDYMNWILDNMHE